MLRFSSGDEGPEALKLSQRIHVFPVPQQQNQDRQTKFPRLSRGGFRHQFRMHKAPINGDIRHTEVPQFHPDIKCHEAHGGHHCVEHLYQVVNRHNQDAHPKHHLDGKLSVLVISMVAFRDTPMVFQVEKWQHQGGNRR